MRRTLLLTALATMAFAAPASAQWYGPEKEFTGFIHTGGSFPSGAAADVVDIGFHIGGGGVYHLNRGPWGIRGDISYDTWGIKSDVLRLANVGDGHARTWAFTTGVEFDQKTTGQVALYGFAGGGLYYNYAELTNPGVGSGIICDPWWGWCYPVLVPVDEIVGWRSTTKGGLNGGLGVRFKTRGAGEMYIEGRFDNIFVDGGNAQYFPVSVGFRW